MKGIVLAGGTGSRLWPITRVTSKQLLPVYDKPMIYYPISTLMLAGIREILIITTPQDQAQFIDLLGDGRKLGVKFKYEVQANPEGLAQALIIAEEFLNSESCLLILGDNLFHGAGLGSQLEHSLPKTGCHIFTYEVTNPNHYGVLNLDPNGVPVSIEEKPKNPTSNLAVTGLYFFDKFASSIAKKISPSLRGELEITSVIDVYLKKNQLTVTRLSRGTAWLDTGNPTALHEAATYVKIIEERTGLKIGCLEEVSYLKQWITKEDLKECVSRYKNNEYGKYLEKIAY